MKTYHLNFNKKAYEGKTKAEFIEAEKHHDGVEGTDIGAEYDKLFPETKKADSKPAKDKAE